MKVCLLILIISVYFSYAAFVFSKEKVRISGFARLLEEEVFLPDAKIFLDVFDWNGHTNNQPEKIASRLVSTNGSGRFATQVEKGKWFRLSLQPGKPPDQNEAMAVWMQHALPVIKEYSELFVNFILRLNSKNKQLLHYIALDTGLMLADSDFVGRNREISFQVPLEITANILKALAWSIYSEEPDESACQLVVTALSPRNNSLQAVKNLFVGACPTEQYQPEVQNLFDCPHGASGVTFSSVPNSRRTHYFGINDKCKTDILEAGLTKTSRDGGAFLVNLTPLENHTVGIVRGNQNGVDLPEKYFLCEPGKIINVSPPHGPAGLRAENDYNPSGNGIGLSAMAGIAMFGASILFSPFSESENSISEDGM